MVMSKQLEWANWQSWSVAKQSWIDGASKRD